MHRFFIEKPNLAKDILTIHEQRVVHQMKNVLRMKQGDTFTFFDASGKESKAHVLEVDRKQITANVIEPIERETEADIHISLYQSIPKKPALFELVVQKATEIGVTDIYPLITERTEKRRLTKFERLQTIAIEATEQCGRTKVPTIHHPVDFEDVIPQLQDAYLAYELEKSDPLAKYLPEIKQQKRASIFIGPEGGFHQKEINFAQQNGVKTFGMGPRILRTETAALSALSIVLLS